MLFSVKPIVMALLGGAGTILGPVVGAFIFLVLEELVWRNLLNFHAGLLGSSSSFCWFSCRADWAARAHGCDLAVLVARHEVHRRRGPAASPGGPS